MNFPKLRKEIEEEIILLEQDIYTLESIIEDKRSSINDCMKILRKIEGLKK